MQYEKNNRFPQNTEDTASTKNIILESAVFRPLSIRKTSSKLSLRSESSVRYERGVDLNQSLEAVNYACYLLEKYADGKVLKGYVHQGINHIDDKLFVLDEKYIESCLGVKITKKRIIEILNSLSFRVEQDNHNILVYVPNRRLDITIKEDLVEEIARINGYDKLLLPFAAAFLYSSLSSAPSCSACLKSLIRFNSP